jgi:hypothetical protein
VSAGAQTNDKAKEMAMKIADRILASTTYEFVDKKIEDISTMLKVNKGNVRLISKEEYENSSENVLEEAENLEKQLQEHSFEMLKADIEYCKAKNPKDFWAYFLRSIKSGHYSAAEIEKKKIAEEKKKLRAELEEKEKKEQEKTNEEKEKIAIEKYKKMTTEEIEKYKKEFDKISENIKKIAFQNSFEVFVISKLKME